MFTFLIDFKTHDMIVVALKVVRAWRTSICVLRCCECPHSLMMEAQEQVFRHVQLIQLIAKMSVHLSRRGILRSMLHLANGKTMSSPTLDLDSLQANPVPGRVPEQTMGSRTSIIVDPLLDRAGACLTCSLWCTIQVSLRKTPQQQSWGWSTIQPRYPSYHEAHSFKLSIHHRT